MQRFLRADIEMARNGSFLLFSFDFFAGGASALAFVDDPCLREAIIQYTTCISAPVARRRVPQCTRTIA